MNIDLKTIENLASKQLRLMETEFFKGGKKDDKECVC
jgi:hypothetical protein